MMCIDVRYQYPLSSLLCIRKLAHLGGKTIRLVSEIDLERNNRGEWLTEVLGAAVILTFLTSNCVSFHRNMPLFYLETLFLRLLGRNSR